MTTTGTGKHGKTYTEEHTLATKNSVTFSVPMSLERGIRKKKTIWLNYNNIHTMHKHEYNTMKKKMTEVVDGLNLDFYFEYYNLHYGIYLPDKARRDISNVGSVIDKFVCDSLSELGFTPEDNYHHLQYVAYEFMGYDKDKKGYVDVTITEVKRRKKT